MEFDHITYGTHSINPNAFPVASLNALLRRGVSHVLGNECASKVAGAVESGTCENTDEAKAAFKAQAQSDMLAALLAGTIGTRVSSGPRVDPLTATMNGIAKREVTQMLKSIGVKKFPKEGEAVQFSDGPRTGEQLLTNWMSGSDKSGAFGKPGEANGPRIKRQAEAHIRELEKARAKASKALAETSDKTAEGLGL